MSLLDFFKSGPETAADLKKRQATLQKQYEADLEVLRSSNEQYTQSKGELCAFNEQYGLVLRIVDGER